MMTFKELCTQPLAPITWEQLLSIQVGTDNTIRRMIVNNIEQPLFLMIETTFNLLEDDNNREHIHETDGDGNPVDEDGNEIDEDDIVRVFSLYLNVIYVTREASSRMVGVTVDAEKLLAIAQPYAKKNVLETFIRRV